MADKIYTKTGDDGSTSLLGNVRVRKDTPRVEACGTLDELNAALGVAAALIPKSAGQLPGWVTGIQSDLMVIGTVLATPPSASKRFAELSPLRVQALEGYIDQMQEDLRPLDHFILPQGTACTSAMHFARAISRRAERRVVTLANQERVDSIVLAYLNRLSDLLYVFARWINAHEGGQETTWTYSAESGGAKTTSETAKPSDRLDASLKKLEAEKQNRQTLFEKASNQMQKKKELADKLFRQNIDQIHKEGGKVEKPLRDMDLD